MTTSDRSPRSRRPRLTVIPGGRCDDSSVPPSDDDAYEHLHALLNAEGTHRVHDDGAVTITYEDALPWLRALQYVARREAMNRHPSVHPR